MIKFNPKLFNPLYWHIKAALRDDKIRYIYVEGGSSASKTYTICQAIEIDQYEYEYSSVVFRRQHVDILDSIYSSFKLAAKGLEMTPDYYYFQQDLIKSIDNKASVRFRGLDDEENIKGIEAFNVVYLNEFNQFTENQWGQMRKRLRGRPNQKFICDWNPVSAKLWQYENWIDTDTWIDLPLNIEGCPSKYSSLNEKYAFKRINAKGDSLWIKVTYRDNFWIVGHPSGKGGYLDSHILADFETDRIKKPNLYRIYANGERGIMRTGGEFWKAFNEIAHVKTLALSPTTLHVSCDQNASPYVTLSLWQLVDKELRQVKELPCKSPDNNAPRAAAVLANYLRSINYKDVLYVYGDPSGSNRSVTDENSASFYDKFIDVLQKEGFRVSKRVRKAHPEVALSAAFINDIYEFNEYGYSIFIGDECKVSIDDYISVQEDKDGTMFKAKIKDKVSGVTYEPIGHFSDAKRYFITTILDEEFEAYKVRSNKVECEVYRGR